MANKATPAPHGGYLAAIFYRVATTHFRTRHRDRHGGLAEPINMQLMFIRRCDVGEALLEVGELKLGTKISTVRVRLLQKSASHSEPIEKIVAHIIVSNLRAERGLSIDQTKIDPVALPKSISHPPATGTSDEDSKPAWRLVQIPYPEFRRAPAHVLVYEPSEFCAQGWAVSSSEQWAALQWKHEEKLEQGRWTNEAAVFLLDVFPETLAGLEKEVNKAQGKPAPVWFPTLALTIDFKRSLPEHGVGWLHSHMTTESIRNGRMDIKVTLRDPDGHAVALATHSTLIMSRPTRKEVRI